MAGRPFRPAGPVIGQLIPELTDPCALGVHRAIAVDPVGADLPAQPPYIRRRHDEELARVVAQAVGGRSAMAVLVGGSSIGKTRACWEAVHRLPPDWRLWRPSDPACPEAVLAELPRMGPRTVVWLNETQLYLDTPDDTGERVAAALCTLLTSSRQAPVLVLGTLWPSHWYSLTRDSTPHVRARAVLTGTDIRVPPMFTGPALGDLRRAAAADIRLQLATEARDGQVSQYLAGVPGLLARYRHAPPAAKALIHAAMDARRLGHRGALPLAFLEAAAPAYLTDTEWDALGEDWLEQALAYTAEPSKGVSGPLTRIRPRPARQGSLADDNQRADGPADLGGGPVYRLADYLDQHGRHQRKGRFPPAGFWAAAAVHAFPADQAALGDAAHARGLYRDAAQLHKNAAAHGDHRAVLHLINTPDYLQADDRPVRWAAVHTTLDDPAAVAGLLVRLGEVGARDQVAALLRRDPAAHVRLDDPFAVAGLLVRLHGAGAREQVAVLAGRAAAYAALDDPAAVAGLLEGLRGVGAQDQVAVLAGRAAAYAALDDPAAVAGLLEGLREVGARDQVAALLRRDPAAHVCLDDPFAVAQLLDRLGGVGARDQVAVLAGRAAVAAALDDPFAVAGLLEGLRGVGARDQVAVLADRGAVAAALDDPFIVAGLLEGLREVGAGDQVAVLAGRAAAGAALDSPSAVAQLLDRLGEVGAQDQATALADRAAAGIALDDPAAVARLLGRLRWVGAGDQVAVLAGRAAAGAALDDQAAVAGLLDRLGELGTQEQVTALADRLPAEGRFDLFQRFTGTSSRFGREPDGRPAEPWGWADLR